MVEFINLTRKRVDYGAFKKLYKTIFPARGKSQSKQFELSVVIASPTLMKKLNLAYRGKKKSANVLSFQLTKNSGEIFLNSAEKDLKYLFLHGLLHLRGYDHVNNKDAEKMEKLEEKILNK